MKNYIKLTEENYFKALELGLTPVDWIKRQATLGSDLLKRVDKVITYDGTILDFRSKYNAMNDGYIEVQTIQELNKLNYKKWIDPYDSEKYIQETDTHIIARGGDGTLIRAIHMHSDKGKPFFGIAAGSLNFLMNNESTISETATIKKLQLLNIEINYQKEIYNLRGHIESYEDTYETVQAFNDIAIGNFNSWINFNCYHDDNILGDFKGSGIIVSTAQGSTGSNKNNNGTILPLCSNNWSITGIMTNRRINYVLDNIMLQIDCNSRENIMLYIDGSHKIFNNIKRIIITKGSYVDVIFNDIQIFKEKRR